MTATIKDVAREASVSIATVSRVFNESGPVSNETRRRVREVAERLRYAPHWGARSLITSRTNTLGALLPTLFGEFFSEVIRGMDQAAKKRGYHLLVSCSHNAKTETEAAIRAMRGRVDGLIAGSPHLDAPSLAANVPPTLPIVLLSSPMTRRGYDALTIENRRGARAMVRHLVGLGHRRIAIITGAAGSYDAAERLVGFRAAMRDAGIDVPNEWELPGHFTEDSGYRAVAPLLAITPRPTAVFAANDSMAIGAMSALREAGLRVPEDIAVTGFDDAPIARYMSPPLTSVHVAIAELGARAVEILLHAVDSKNEHDRRHHRIPATLVIRDSCGARLQHQGSGRL
ncbi:MAG TPA: LacI family DNA-binding transcriptional regulator [Gemmatimonadaceae bacterium]|nr:LacI family DNA-binding transcriptional regulator [Gemmatimonadaceae bacterium]